MDLGAKVKKLILEVDYTKVEGGREQELENEERFNYLICMLNTIGKFDIFNELVINKGYQNLAPGCDYSVGIRYGITPDLHINLKDENILDKGMTRKYYYNLFSVAKQIEVSIVEQKFMLSMEYLF